MTDSTLLFEAENMIATLRDQLAAVQREKETWKGWYESLFAARMTQPEAERDALQARAVQLESERDKAWGELGFMKNDLGNAEARAVQAEAERDEARARREPYQEELEALSLLTAYASEHATPQEIAKYMDSSVEWAIAKLTAFEQQVAALRASPGSAELERLRDIIRWMLGQKGSFPVQPDASPAALKAGIKGRPLYWWRTELRERFYAVSPAPPVPDVTAALLAACRYWEAKKLALDAVRPDFTNDQLRELNAAEGRLLAAIYAQAEATPDTP